MEPQPIGQILLEDGLIKNEQLTHALALQKRQGGRLGDILVAEGAINYHKLYQALAAHYEIPYTDLLKNPPDTRLLDPRLAQTYIKMRCIPWKKENARTVIATSELNDEVLHFCRSIVKGQMEFVFTSPFDIRRAVESSYAKEMELHSRLWLWSKDPEASARQTLFPRQRVVLYGILGLSLLSLLLFPLKFGLAFFAFCHIAYAITMLFKQFVFSHGATCTTEWTWEKKLGNLDDRDLPVYTILLPMYRETESLKSLMKCMQRFDYPASKLDIKLVLESDDKETLASAIALKLRYQFDIIRVPSGGPRTKPRACNYALQFARGELVTIFDADDRPDPLQLKKAVAAFASLSPDVVCLQARLNYFNANDNMLTRFFSLEYSILFHFMLYGLQRLGMPIPLGGTSNHISLARLKELGEWDPYNVTEDADLGARLAARGLKTAMLDSYTMEEAPNRVWPWIKQRSRWVKGYMQTWLVHMRHPARFYRQVGLRGFIGFQCFIGLPCFTFLTAPLVWGLAIAWLASMPPESSISVPAWLVWLTAINMVINIFTHWYQAFYCAWQYRVHVGAISLAALLYPFYMVLHSVASYRALWQLAVNPHFWDKTAHGVSKALKLAPAR
ncbi:MAG: glycosyltransferase [Alphaproteobacteria bacterium]